MIHNTSKCKDIYLSWPQSNGKSMSSFTTMHTMCFTSWRPSLLLWSCWLYFILSFDTGPRYADQPGLELRDPPISACQVLGLEACATNLGLLTMFWVLRISYSSIVFNPPSPNSRGKIIFIQGQASCWLFFNHNCVLDIVKCQNDQTIFVLDYTNMLHYVNWNLNVVHIWEESYLEVLPNLPGMLICKRNPSTWRQEDCEFEPG